MMRYKIPTNRHDYKYFEGSEKNVLKRFYLCAKKFRGSNIIRITSDCPLADPKIIDKLAHIQNNLFL